MALLERISSEEDNNENVGTIASQTSFYIDQLQKIEQDDSPEKKAISVQKAIKIIPYLLKFSETIDDVEAIESLLNEVDKGISQINNQEILKMKPDLENFRKENNQHRQEFSLV